MDTEQQRVRERTLRMSWRTLLLACVLLTRRCHRVTGDSYARPDVAQHEDVRPNVLDADFDTNWDLSKGRYEDADWSPTTEPTPPSAAPSAAPRHSAASTAAS